MSKLESPEADFYEILQVRINELEQIVKDLDSDDQVKRNNKLTISAIVAELKHLQGNFNSYMYKIKHKHQAD